MKRGDVYFVQINKGVGSEQSGTRPAVIVQNDVGNTYSPTVIVALITASSTKKFIQTHLDIKLMKPSTILCEQIVTISKDRLIEKITTLSSQAIRQLDSKLKISLGLN
jgi:mRNA interferase MazF